MMPTPEDSLDDPFGTAELRSAVLSTWLRSPARFREDANAEESLAMVGYAGRVVVELAANAADAAIDAAVPGRIRITLNSDETIADETIAAELRVANTGSPLTAAGVASLASLRASAKRTGNGGIGHFGVGFTAVLAISEHPAVISTTGGVRFAGAATAAAVAALGSAELDAEVTVRDGHVPVLRLPWPAAGRPPDGFNTEVRLPLRPGIDAEAVLHGVGDYLLLALPGLEQIELPGRCIRREDGDAGSVLISDAGVRTNWRLVTRCGRFSDELLAALPTEERHRRDWRLTWAHPTNRQLGPDVLYSPTPTDELLDLPARLIGSFPVDDTRRHVSAGPITDQLIDEAVAGYLELMADTMPEERLTLLPPRDFGRSELDNRLRQGIWTGIQRTALLVSAAGEAVRPDQAAILPGASEELISLAAEAIPGLLPVPRDGVERDGLRAIGVRTIGYPELSSALGGLSRGPEFWGRVYGQLDSGSGEDLADLPVPLVSGRTVLGGRGCLIVDDQGGGWLTAISNAVSGLRVIHPVAAAAVGAHRLLLRIGAQTADPTAVLADPAVLRVAAELREELEADDVAVDRVEEFARAVLDLIAAGGSVSEELRSALLLTNDSGEPWPAAELLLPGAPLSAVLDGDADLEELGADWVRRYQPEQLISAGVLAGFRVLRDAAASGPDHDLPDEDQYWEQLGDRQPAGDFLAIADLDLVADDRWPAALELIRTDRTSREALQPNTGAPSYTSWWLSRYALIEGQPPSAWRLPGAADLSGLYDPLPVPMDADFAALIGVQSSLDHVLAEDPEEILRRFTDGDRRVPSARVPQLTAALVATMLDRPVDELPPGVRTLSGQVAAADDIVVVDQPWLAQLLEPAEAVPGGTDPVAVARFFDLELASERLPHQVVADSGPPGADERDRAGEAAVALGLSVDSWLGEVRSAPDLQVQHGNDRRAVRWWVEGGSSWVDGSPDGWGRLLAFRAGDWSLRHTAIALVAGRSTEVVEDGLGTARSAPR